MCSIGAVSNQDNKSKFGKAGRKRWMGKRPSVRGGHEPDDHPHGGGEGRTSGADILLHLGVSRQREKEPETIKKLIG